MLSLCIRALVLCSGWVLWKIFCRFFFKSTLDNIPGPPSQSLWRGCFPQIFNVHAWDFHRDIADKYGSVIKIKALFGENQIYVFDPKAMHHIVVKDQDIYEETSAFILGNHLMFGPGLLATLGEQHRRQRKMLNPVFSIAHLREMIPTFYSVTSKLSDAFASEVKDGPCEIEILSWMTRAALEIIGQSGMGYSFDSLINNRPSHPYTTAAKRLIPVAFKYFFERTYYLPIISKIGSPRFRRYLLDLLPSRALHELRDIIDVLETTAVEIYEAKQKALAEGDREAELKVSEGKDIMSILVKANMNALVEDRLSREELLAQISSLTFAAMDTTSGALCRTLWLLAMHQDVQDKLRYEVGQALNSDCDVLSYDDLVSLPYLDSICRETMRLYPPITMVRRTTKKTVNLPLSNPIRGLDGTEMQSILVPKNTDVIVSILASNRNRDIWGPDSHEWKPERWLQPLPDSVTNVHIPGIYSNLMTFLGGGRACIGFKFSQLEMKVILSFLINKFKFSLSDKKIVWNMTNIVTPVLAGSPHQPQLPLIVEFAKE